MKHYVGLFNEQDLINKVDKIAIANAIKETGLKYIDSRFVTRKGIHYLEVNLIDTEAYLKSDKI